MKQGRRPTAKMTACSTVHGRRGMRTGLPLLVVYVELCPQTCAGSLGDGGMSVDGPT